MILDNFSPTAACIAASGTSQQGMADSSAPIWSVSCIQGMWRLQQESYHLALAGIQEPALLNVQFLAHQINIIQTGFVRSYQSGKGELTPGWIAIGEKQSGTQT